MILRLNLDNSYPTSDAFHTTNTAGTVRFIDGRDPNQLDAMNRFSGDVVHRDFLIQEKVNELVLAINRLTASETNGPQSGTGGDSDQSSLSAAVAILGERLRMLKALSTFESNWVEVPWESQDKLKRVDLTLLNRDVDGTLSPLVNVDFDKVVSLSLIIKADVSSIGVTDPQASGQFIYRSATYGQTRGFKFDDVWMTPPNRLSFLIPYLSSFSNDYPASSGYVAATQPSRIWVKAVMVSSQPPSVVPDDQDLPSLDFTSGELVAIIDEVIRQISASQNLALTIPDHVGGSYSPLVSRNADGTLKKHQNVVASETTIRLRNPGTVNNGSFCVRLPNGDIKELALITTAATIATRPLLRGVDGRFYLGAAEQLTSKYLDSPVSVASAAAANDVSTGIINTQRTISLGQLTTVPTWATHAIIRARVALSPEARNNIVRTRSSARVMINENVVAAIGLLNPGTTNGSLTDNSGADTNDVTVKLSGQSISYEFQLTKGTWWTEFGGQAEFRLDLVGFIRSVDEASAFVGDQTSLTVVGGDTEAIDAANAELAVQGTVEYWGVQDPVVVPEKVDSVYLLNLITSEVPNRFESVIDGFLRYNGGVQWLQWKRVRYATEYELKVTNGAGATVTKTVPWDDPSNTSWVGDVLTFSIRMLGNVGDPAIPSFSVIPGDPSLYRIFTFTVTAKNDIGSAPASEPVTVYFRTLDPPTITHSLIGSTSTTRTYRITLTRPNIDSLPAEEKFTGPFGTYEKGFNHHALMVSHTNGFNLASKVNSVLALPAPQAANQPDLDIMYLQAFQTYDITVPVSAGNFYIRAAAIDSIVSQPGGGGWDAIALSVDTFGSQYTVNVS